MGKGRSRSKNPSNGRITISEIRDQENETIPNSALNAIADRISDSLGELGLRAVIEASEK